ncbi:hypothetical protein PV725_27700, partial [Streptomyces scabiei]|nr:hypothetical protein [Streptomyces scabiei]
DRRPTPALRCGNVSSARRVGGRVAAGGQAGPGRAGAATAGAAVAVQAAAVVVQTGMQAASEVAGSLDDNDGMKGHNQ